MGKLDNIKKSVAEGKGSLKMLEYLLRYIESMKDQSLAEEQFRLQAGDGPKHEFLGLVMRIEAQRNFVDRGEKTIEEYHHGVNDHYRYKDLKKP